MKIGLSILAITIFTLFNSTPAFAHAGCCSSHGGVRADGCGCNDGSDLSAKCAPYYECAQPAAQTEQQPVVQPTTPPVIYYTPVPRVYATSAPKRVYTTSKPNPKLTQKPKKKNIVKKIAKKKVVKIIPTPTPTKNFFQQLFGL